MPNPAEDALAASGLPHRLISHGPVRTLAEAAQARGVTPADVVTARTPARSPAPGTTITFPGHGG